MLPFSSVTIAGPSAGAAMLPYCLVPAATGIMPPAGTAAGSSTLARSSRVIFSVGLSSLFAIVSFCLWGFLLRSLQWLLRRAGLVETICVAAIAQTQNSRVQLIKLPERFYELPISFRLLKYGGPP